MREGCRHSHGTSEAARMASVPGEETDAGKMPALVHKSCGQDAHTPKEVLAAHELFPAIGKHVELGVRIFRVRYDEFFIDFDTPSGSGGQFIIPVLYSRGPWSQVTPPRDIIIFKGFEYLEVGDIGA